MIAEVAGAQALADAAPAWRDLARRAAEPNPFADPAFLEPALRRLGSPRLVVLIVWADPARTRMTGLAVLREPRFALGLASLWRSEQAGLPACLFDAAELPASLAALIALLRKRRPRLAGLSWPGLEVPGPVASALRALAARDALRLETLTPVRRAALRIDARAAFDAGLDPRRRKEWARQARRLAERGRVETSVGADAVEEFLALESKGWKGARGTSLDGEPDRLAFAREALAGFAAKGDLAIHRLALDGSAIAMGIVLRAGSRAYYWKTAYDPEFAEFSPGVQLTLALSRALAADPTLSLADSCALENHPMIDRLWPARLELADLALALRPDGAAALGRWLAFERARRAGRARIKQAAYRLLKRKRS